ncbi:MAG: hypothetical protein HY547_03330 [Elusimicrobia bacterium]|nr:hypothetical protein [Elusimicrobiota bacterium]
MQEKRDKKKVLIVLFLGVGIFGTLAWWMVGPMIMDSMKQADQSDGVYANIFDDDVNASRDATEKEQEYLDQVNEPIDLGEEDEGSLALIKRGKFPTKKKTDGEKSAYDSYKSRRSRDYTPKVSSYSSMKSKMKGALQKMGLGSLLGGSSGGSRGGYSSGDLDKYKSRFAKDSGYQGGKVVTGPSAAKTKVSGKGTRGNPDPTTDRLAKATGSKFGESSMARPVDPKTAAQALRDASGSVPKDLSGKSDKSDAAADDNFTISDASDEDECAGTPAADKQQSNLMMMFGAAMVALGAVGGDVGAGISAGAPMLAEGIGNTANPNRAYEMCKSGASQDAWTMLGQGASQVSSVFGGKSDTESDMYERIGRKVAGADDTATTQE